MVSFCVASEAEAIVPELMALIPPLICGIATLCALACLAVTPVVCGKARTSPTTRPPPDEESCQCDKEIAHPSSPLFGRAGCFSACRSAACGASGRSTASVRGFAAEMTPRGGCRQISSYPYWVCGIAPMAGAAVGGRLNSESSERRSHAHLDGRLGLALDDADDGLLAGLPRRGHLHRGAARATAADEAEDRLMNARLAEPNESGKH